MDGLDSVKIGVKGSFALAGEGQGRTEGQQRPGVVKGIRKVNLSMFYVYFKSIYVFNLVFSRKTKTETASCQGKHFMNLLFLVPHICLPGHFYKSISYDGPQTSERTLTSGLGLITPSLLIILFKSFLYLLTFFFYCLTSYVLAVGLFFLISCFVFVPFFLLNFCFIFLRLCC